MSDLELLARHAPIVRFNEGEYFLPASVDSFVAQAELWARRGSVRTLVGPAGSLDLDRLCELTAGHGAEHYLRLVTRRLPTAELVAWRLRRDRPRFRAETRLGQVGVFARLIDAGAKLSLLVRGKVPAGAEAAAAIADRDRPDHGDHPYYGRVVRTGGYLVLQYWYFSYFNDWRSRAHGVNDHEGDWEQVTIFLTESPDAAPTPAWVAFSAHDSVGADLRRRWDDPDLTVVEGHPVVHAALGSHAGEFLAGEYLLTVPGTRLAPVWRTARRISALFLPWTRDRVDEAIGVPYVEYARGDGVGIGHGEERAWRPVLIDDSTPWVVDYRGLWGDDTDDPFGGERGPAGPRYLRDGSVRPAWADPVGWAALDEVTPEPEVTAVVTARLTELDEEIAAIGAERDRLRVRLRAAALGRAADAAPAQSELAALGQRETIHRDERRRLQRVRDQPDSVVQPHPHAHLRHRRIPLPDEPVGRRRVLRVWAVVSTPLLLVLVGLLVLPLDVSVLTAVSVGMVAVFGIEAAARRKLLAFLIGLAAAVVAVSILTAIVAGLLASWRITVAAVVGVLALALLTLNLREMRRT